MRIKKRIILFVIIAVIILISIRYIHAQDGEGAEIDYSSLDPEDLTELCGEPWPGNCLDYDIVEYQEIYDNEGNIIDIEEIKSCITCDEENVQQGAVVKECDLFEGCCMWDCNKFDEVYTPEDEPEEPELDQGQGADAFPDPCEGSDDPCCTYSHSEILSDTGEVIKRTSCSSYTNIMSLFDYDDNGIVSGSFSWDNMELSAQISRDKYRLEGCCRVLTSCWRSCASITYCRSGTDPQSELVKCSESYPTGFIGIFVKDIEGGEALAFEPCQSGAECNKETCGCEYKSELLSVKRIDGRALFEDYYINNHFIYRFVPYILFNGNPNFLKLYFSDVIHTGKLEIIYKTKDNEEKKLSYTAISTKLNQEGENYEGELIISLNNLNIEEFDEEGKSIYPLINPDITVRHESAGATQEFKLDYNYICKARDSVEYTIRDETSINPIAAQTGLTKKEIEDFNIGKELLFAPGSSISVPDEIISLSGKVKYESMICIHGTNYIIEDNYCSQTKSYIEKGSCPIEYVDVEEKIIDQYNINTHFGFNDGILNIFATPSTMTAYVVRDVLEPAEEGIAYLLKSKDGYLDELPSNIGISITHYSYESERNNFKSLYVLTSKEVIDNCLIEVLNETILLNLNENPFVESTDGMLSLNIPYNRAGIGNLSIQIVNITGPKQGKSCSFNDKTRLIADRKGFFDDIIIWVQSKNELPGLIFSVVGWIKND